jgi:succinyl-CoA synthetase alpha subunit
MVAAQRRRKGHADNQIKRGACSLAILVDAGSRVLVQGMTGTVGRSMTRRLLDAGTPVVAGVVPGHAGERYEGLPVFDCCREAMLTTEANCSLIVVPAPSALDAALEAIEAGMRLIVLYIENVPVLDAMRIATFARARGVLALGPNSAGCIDPGGISLSEMDKRLLVSGRIGVVAKSGAMCAEAAESLKQAGLGCSTIVSIGGDPILGVGHAEILRRFEADEATDGVVMVGEIGGRSEIEAAHMVRRMTKPVVGLIIGRSAPPGKRMGHAGALLGVDEENWWGKTNALKEAGAVIAEDVFEVGERMRHALLGV